MDTSWTRVYTWTRPSNNSFSTPYNAIGHAELSIGDQIAPHPWWSTRRIKAVRLTLVVGITVLHSQQTIEYVFSLQFI